MVKREKKIKLNVIVNERMVLNTQKEYYEQLLNDGEKRGRIEQNKISSVQNGKKKSFTIRQNTD